MIQLLAVRNSPEVDYTIVNHMDLGEVDGDNLSDARTLLASDTSGSGQSASEKPNMLITQASHHTCYLCALSRA